MGLISLTSNDVLILLNERSVESRLQVTSLICEGYAASKYSKEEMQIAEEIFRMLVKDVEVKIRAALAEALRLCPFLPHDIAQALARDVAEVAIPMIQYSDVLTEQDFDEIIKSHQVQKILAISRREKISPETLQKLAASGFDEVIESVIANDNLTHEAKKIFFTVTKQTQLPLKLNETIMNEVSARILQQLNARYEIGPHKKAQAVASHVTEISILSIINHHSRTVDIQFLVDHLDFKGKLTNSLILSALCMGRRRFFLYALAKKSKTTMRDAIILIKRHGRDGLRALLTRANVPEKLFDAIELVVRLTDEKKRTQRDISVNEFCTWLLGRLEYFSERSRIEYLSYLMAIAKQTQLDQEEAY